MQPTDSLNQDSLEGYQESFLSIGVIVVVLIMAFLLTLTVLPAILSIIMLLIIVPILLLAFFKLTIKVEAKRLVIIYGIGLFSKVVHPSDIKNIKIVENKSFLSWLYNPTGQDAIVIQFRNNQTINVPSNQPKKLIAALRY